MGDGEKPLGFLLRKMTLLAQNRRPRAQLGAAGIG